MRLKQNVVESLCDILVAKGVHVCQQLVYHDPGRKQIRSLIVVTAPDLLRRHVNWRSQSNAGARQIGGGDACDAKIQDFYRPGGRDLNVAGLDVAMDNFVQVSMAQTIGHLDDYGE